MSEIEKDCYPSNSKQNTLYAQGYSKGQSDAELIFSSLNNGTVHEQYSSIKSLYEEAILSNDKWMEGYAQGFDDYCVKNKK